MSATEAQAGEQSTPEQVSKRPRWGLHHQHDAEDGVHRTRISGLWTAVIVATFLGVALIDFIVQNTRSVRIEFFGAAGQISVAVALLGAALAGAFLVLAVGIARTTQLRIANRREKRQRDRAESMAADSGQ